MSIDLVLPHAYSPTAGAITPRLPILTTNSRQNRFGSTTPIVEATKAASVSFTRIPDAVLLDTSISPIELRIYAVIARRVGRENASAFPSYTTIADDANISRTSAINGVKKLVALGYLAKRSQQSGQGDPTSNRYTISGEGSAIFAPRGVPSGEVVQSLHHGSANAAPELDSKNKKKSNKTQENRIARMHTHEEASAATTTAVAPDSELQVLFTDFQENIGALSAMAKHVIGDLVVEYSTDQVRKAIQEAVIYEKRSLAYVRRVLHAWKRDGRAIASSTDTSSLNAQPIPEESAQSALTWPPPGLNDDLPTASSDKADPAVAAWEAICEQLPDLGRLRRMVTPISFVDDVLTVSVSDARAVSVITNTQRHLVEYATWQVLGSEASLRVDMIQSEAGAV